MSEELPVCPRCLGYIPNNETPGAYVGALSRSDNETEICSQCGQDEAFAQMAGYDLDDEKWPIPDGWVHGMERE
jgi:hypothetical protein